MICTRPESRQTEHPMSCVDQVWWTEWRRLQNTQPSPTVAHSLAPGFLLPESKIQWTARSLWLFGSTFSSCTINHEPESIRHATKGSKAAQAWIEAVFWRQRECYTAPRLGRNSQNCDRGAEIEDDKGSWLADQATHQPTPVQLVSHCVYCGVNTLRNAEKVDKIVCRNLWEK